MARKPNRRASRPVIHLLAVAGSCLRLPRALACTDARDLIRLIQDSVGHRYRVKGSPKLMDAAEDETVGGRQDDVSRARDLQTALADDNVTAIVSLRGGSWLTRILNHVDFDVLDRRKTPVAIFGFSELTTIVNIASQYACARCFYDLGPAFLRVGLEEYAREYAGPLGCSDPQDAKLVRRFARHWAAAHFREEFLKFFTDVIDMIEGRGSSRPIRARLVSGSMPRRQAVRFAGGTLAVMSPLIGTPFQSAIEPDGDWLVIEDVNEAPYRVDRVFAHLNLAGILPRYGGFLVGDFHDDQGDRVKAVLACLKRNLPARSRVPIMLTRDVGHTWPMGPLPLRQRLRWCLDPRSRAKDRYILNTPWSELATMPRHHERASVSR